MFELKTELKPQNNKLTTFFPINTKDRIEVFDWDTVLGHFIKSVYGKHISIDELSKFKATCQTVFEYKLDHPSFWREIKEMYFEGEELFKITPELLLFKAKHIKGSSANRRLGDLFINMLHGFQIQGTPDIRVNFLEREIVNAFYEFSQTGNDAKATTEALRENPYLPFLSRIFVQDVCFLASRPKYFISNVKDFLKLYAFLYTAQLTLNLGEWRNGEPTAKPCFFILDNERASEERTWVKDFGYKQLKNNLDKIFPFLAMSESIQQQERTKEPIWQVANYINEIDCIDKLNNYATAFKEDRNLDSRLHDAQTPIEGLSNLLQLSYDQFKRGESRHEINVTYCKAIETELCGHFIQNRGRAGRVLVFNQDYILLLTNLAIGEREQMRLHELIAEFKARGVCFDKQTQKLLVRFYERIGNVERMSDSGDAVYVRKTV